MSTTLRHPSVIAAALLAALVAGALRPATALAATPGTVAAARPTTTLAAAEVVARAEALGLIGTFRAGSGSAAGYRMVERSLPGGRSTDAVGRTTRTDGTLTLEGSATGVIVKTFEVRVDMTGLQSGDALRDQRMRTAGLQTDRYRTATFVADPRQRVPDAAASGKDLRWEVTGRLALHGVTRRVRLPLLIGIRNGRLEVVGAVAVTLADHRIVPPGVPGVLEVGPVATFELKVVFFR